MRAKSLSVVLLGLALFCFLQTTSAQGADSCLLKFWSGYLYEYRQGEGVYNAPFNSLQSLKAVETVASSCDSCVLTVFEGAKFNGTSHEIDFRTRVGNSSRVDWSFDAESYKLQCFPEVETMRILQEEDYGEEEEEGGGYWQEEVGEEREEEEEEEEYEPDPEEEGTAFPQQFNNIAFKEMNEHDGSTLTYSLVELRETATQPAIDLLIGRGLLPQSQYTTSRVYATEIPAHPLRNTHKFHLHVRDANGVDYRIWFITITLIHNGYQLVDAGYWEKRIGEFSGLSWEVEANVPVEVTNLGTKSAPQAARRMAARSIIPQGSYSVANITSVEFSAIVNMKEYPDHEDGLYRFSMILVDTSGLVWKAWFVIATNYETPENYELIDFGYVENTLADFSKVKFLTLNEDAIKTKAVMEAVNRMVAKGVIPDGNGFTLTNTYSTEYALGFESPFYANNGFILTNFTVQVTNTYDKPYKIYVIVITDDDKATSGYAIVDYGLIKSG